VSVLSKPEVSSKYAKNYVAAHVDFGEIEADDPPQQAMIKRYNSRQLRPLLVFLDAQGKEVARVARGLKSVEDALLLDRFVSGRHYRKIDFPGFKAAQRG